MSFASQSQNGGYAFALVITWIQPFSRKWVPSQNLKKRPGVGKVKEEEGASR
jgi:hypothetical protein